jgi:hypothetical protein
LLHKFCSLIMVSFSSGDASLTRITVSPVVILSVRFSYTKGTIGAGFCVGVGIVGIVGMAVGDEVTVAVGTGAGVGSIGAFTHPRKWMI